MGQHQAIFHSAMAEVLSHGGRNLISKLFNRGISPYVIERKQKLGKSWWTAPEKFSLGGVNSGDWGSTGGDLSE